MSYRAEFDGHALVQLRGLPRPAFDALVTRVAELVEQPWDATVAPPGDDPAFRWTTFGDGLGLVSFYVDDAAGLLRIYDLAWIG